MKSFVLLVLVALPLFFYGQFHTPTVNGTIAPNEYGNHSDGQNRGGNVFITWDNNNLYVGVQNASRTEAFVIYLDVNPIIPINGGTNSNGTIAGFTYDNTNFAELPFRADFVLYVKNDYREFRSANGTNGWGTQTTAFGSYGDNESNIREFSIPWSSIGGARPSSFNFFCYNTSSVGFVYNQQPNENASGTIGTTARYPRYFTVTSTNDGSSTPPFSRNSYVFNSTTDINNFGVISVWDFTMNTSGRQIARSNSGGDWNIAGTLLVNSGTVFFGSGGSVYGNSNVSNVNVTGGSLNLDQTNKKLVVSNNVTIGSVGNLNLSGTSGGDLELQGNFTNNGTFNGNGRAVFFNGAQDQDVTGTLTIPFIIVDKTGGSVNLQNNISVSGNLQVTSGTFNLGAFTANRTAAGGTLTLGSSGTLRIGGTNSFPTNYDVHSIASGSTIEYSGTTQSIPALNSSQNYGNLIISGSGTKSLSTTIGIAGNLSVNAGTLNLGSFTANRTTLGGSLTLASNTTLQIGGTNTFPSNFNTHTIDATSTVEYNGSTQTIAALNSSQNYGNLTVSNSGLKTLGSSLTVGGTLNLNTSTTTAIGANTLTLNGTVTGTGTLRGGATSNLSIGGSGPFGTLRMDNTNNEISNLLNNVTINRTGSGSVDLGARLDVGGTLTLTAGDLNVGSNVLTLKGPYPSGNIDNLKTTSGSVVDFQTTGSGSTYTLPAFTNIGRILINSNNVFQLNSSPTFQTGIYTGSGILSIGANTVTQLGEFGAGSGRIRGGTSSNLVIAGSGTVGNLPMDLTTPGVTNVLNNLTMNRTGGELPIWNALRLVGTLTPTAGIVVSNGNLTLASTISGNARVAAGSATVPYVTGDVRFERWMNRTITSSKNGRAWRFVSIPAEGTGGDRTVRMALANEAPNANAVIGEDANGKGTLITGPGLTDGTIAASQGFDWWSTLGALNSSSIRTYTAVGNGGNFNATPANIHTTPLNEAVPYMLFVRGDRSIRGIFDMGQGNPISSTTTLTAVGLMRQGPKTAPITLGTSFQPVGNPYFSPINMQAFLEDADNSSKLRETNKFYIWDANLAGTNGLGAFRAITKQGDNSWKDLADPTNEADFQYIQPWQAFIVEPATGSGSANLTFKESHKGVPGNNFQPFDASNSLSFINVNLQLLQPDATRERVEGVAAIYGESRNLRTRRLASFTGNLGLGITGIDEQVLSIDERNIAPGTADTLRLRTTALTARPYSLSINTQYLQVAGAEVVLRDLFTNTETPLPVGEVFHYDFTPTSNTASTSTSRFQIIVRAGTVLPVTFTGLQAQEQQGDVALSWQVAAEVNVKDYTVEHSRNGQQFSAIGQVAAAGAPAYSFMHHKPGGGQHFYRVRSTDTDGKTLLTEVVRVLVGSGKDGFSIFPTVLQGGNAQVQLSGLPAGAYSVQMVDMQGKVLSTQQLDYSGGNAAQRLQVPATLPAGQYIIRVQGAGGVQYTERLLKQ